MRNLVHVGGDLDGQESEWQWPTHGGLYAEGLSGDFPAPYDDRMRRYTVVRYVFHDIDVWVLARDPHDHEFNRRRILELNL